jgi:hypothetical protein
MGISAIDAVTRIVSAAETLPKVSGGIKNTFENFADGAKAALIPLGQGVNALLESMGPLADGMLSKLSEMGRSAGEVIAAIGKSGVIQEVVGSLGGVLKEAFGGTDFRNITIELVAGIASVIQALPGFVSAVWQNIRATFEAARSYLAGVVAGFSTLAGGVMEAISKIADHGIFGIAPARESIKKAMDSYKMDQISAMVFNLPTTFVTNVPNLLGNQKNFSAAIREQLKPLPALPEGLTYGGAPPTGENKADETFAKWDGHLAKIEANTRKAADVLTARVVGGGPQARLGLTAAELAGAPSPITRPVSSQLENAVVSLTRKTARDARKPYLYGVR